MTNPETPICERLEAMRVWLLSSFRVSVGARTIEAGEWRLRKAASLVKLLALAPGHRLHKEQAMDLLWPHLERRAASNNLRQVVHVTRHTLAPTDGSLYLASDSELLVLCPRGDLWVDADAFEVAATTARRAREAAAYRAAIDLYAGDLLPEDRYEAWAEDRREGLRQTYLALLVGLAKLHEDRDEHGPAIDALRKVTDEEPTLEEAYAALMRLYALSGKPEQALAQYERLRGILSRTLGQQPAEATLRLHDEIAAGRFPPPAEPPQVEGPTSAGNHNLTAPRTSFVGREREIVEIKRTLAMTRLMTITGAGGSGKTRLALEVARDLVGAYPDGVWLVQLAALSEPDLVAQEVAGVLGIKERPGQPLSDTLADALRVKNLLLVLDNCEHLVVPAARLVDRLLSSCPRLKVLATSREMLAVSGEVNRPVPPLSLPAAADEGPRGGPAVEDLVRCEAVRLFLERARLRLPHFELTEENAGAVARVCRRLDGIPLAIELATGRMGALAVEQVAQKLEVSFDILKSASRIGEVRQRTLRATLDWSHDLLSADERTALRRLCVFAGGWSLEAAEAVSSGEGIEREDVLDLLEGLVDKSLVIALAQASGTKRYRMLEIIRQYAREKMEESGEVEQARGRHAAFFLALAEEAEPELAGTRQGLWVGRLEGEHDNLRAALSWVLDREEGGLALRFVGALWRFWFNRGHMSEGIGWLDQALAENAPTSAPARVKALEGMGWLAQRQGGAERAEEAYEEMLEIARELGDKRSMATAINSRGALALDWGDKERARALLKQNLVMLEKLDDEGDTATSRFHALNLLAILVMQEDSDYARGTALLEESLALAHGVADSYCIEQALCNLGYAALLQGNYMRTIALCEEALDFADKVKGAGVENVPEILINLGHAKLGRGEHELAAASFKEALTVSQKADRKPSVINALEGMASLAGGLEESTRAARLRGAADAARQETGIPLPTIDRALHRPYLQAARSSLGQAAWKEALTEGRAMSLDVAVEYALAEEDHAPPTVPMPDRSPAFGLMGNLTRREQEVAHLVIRGLTNRRIAAELSISERTAGNHVAKVLRKLGLRSRAQIAARAGAIVDAAEGTAPGMAASDG
jgi:predicted ATPase/DNA-binding SARP family transcriptional activator/DNA-binding CsgD family transcriptional regulator